MGLRINRGRDIEYSNAENNPAAVPPITLTKAKRTIAVKEPNTAGNNIVKS